MLFAYEQWILQAKENANILAKTFANKATLPPSASGHKHEVGNVAVHMQEFIFIRIYFLLTILKNVKLNTAFKPNKLNARISKTNNACIAVFM